MVRIVTNGERGLRQRPAGRTMPCAVVIKMSVNPISDRQSSTHQRRWLQRQLPLQRELSHPSFDAVYCTPVFCVARRCLLILGRASASRANDTLDDEALPR